MTNTLRRTAALASCVIAFCWSALLAGGSVAHAADPSAGSGGAPRTTTTYNTVQSKFSLTVSPTRLEISPTDIAKQHEITVVNRGQVPIPVTVQKRDFTGGIDGSMNFQKHAPYSASRWLSVQPANFTLAPGTAQIVTTTVTVPANPEPGDHQVALVFLVPAGQTAANVRINRGVASPVYITVPGATDDSTTVSDLSAPGFSSGGAINISATVHDMGTVHRDFRGSSALRLTGAGSTPFPDFTVMRGSTREVSTTWHAPFMCICHPKITIVDADGTVHTVSVRVIVFPLPLILSIVGALLLLAMTIVVLHRRHARRGDG